jgi:uncharacterized protein
MHYLLIYDYVPDVLEKRGPYRAEHLRLGWESESRGELILAGAFADPVDGAVLLFRADSPQPIEAFVARDPYVQNGLVTRWQIRKWGTVIGKDATTPVRPEAV